MIEFYVNHKNKNYPKTTFTLVYIKYIELRNRIYYLLMIVCFILSFGGKEQAVTLPFCLIWIDFLYHRDFKSYKLWYEKIPLLVITISLVLITLASHGNANLLIQDDSYTIIQRIVFASYAFIEYITKTLIPVQLLYQYAFPMVEEGTLPCQFWIYPFIIIVIVICLRQFWKQRVVLLGISWFIIHVGLMLHIIPMSRFVITADRYMYLAILGLFLIIIRYLHIIYTIWPKLRKVLIVCFLSWVLFLCLQTHRRVYAWQDNTTLNKELNELRRLQKINSIIK